MTDRQTHTQIKKKKKKNLEKKKKLGKVHQKNLSGIKESTDAFSMM